MTTHQPPRGELLLYQTEDGRTRIECRFEGDTIWLTQAQLAALFETTPQNITLHLRDIYASQELERAATCKSYLQVRTEGTRQVQRSTLHYSLPAVLAVGFRVRSHRGTQFRRWAIKVLEEYVQKGFVMDDERLKNPPGPGHADYFDYLLERIRDIEIAKNYLSHQELEALNSVVSAYLEFADLQASNRRVMYMRDWIEKLDSFLKLADKDVLTNAGNVSHKLAVEHATAQFERFRQQQATVPSRVERDFEEAIARVQRIEATVKTARGKAGGRAGKKS